MNTGTKFLIGSGSVYTVFGGGLEIWVGLCVLLPILVCPFAEVHPLLGVKGDGKSKKKQAGRPKGSKGKEKDSPFKPKLYKGDRGLPLEGAAKGRVQAEPSQPLTGKDPW